MGHSMEDKVLKPLLHRKLKDKSLRKPLLVRLLKLLVVPAASLTCMLSDAADVGGLTHIQHCQGVPHPAQSHR